MRRITKAIPRILLVDEWGGGADVSIANDIAAAGAWVYLLYQSDFKLTLPIRVVQLPAADLTPPSLAQSITTAVEACNPDVA